MNDQDNMHIGNFDEFYYCLTFASMSKNSLNERRTLEISTRLEKTLQIIESVILKKNVLLLFDEFF